MAACVPMPLARRARELKEMLKVAAQLRSEEQRRAEAWGCTRCPRPFPANTAKPWKPRAQSVLVWAFGGSSLVQIRHGAQTPKS